MGWLLAVAVAVMGAPRPLLAVLRMNKRRLNTVVHVGGETRELSYFAGDAYLPTAAQFVRALSAAQLEEVRAMTGCGSTEHAGVRALPCVAGALAKEMGRNAAEFAATQKHAIPDAFLAFNVSLEGSDDTVELRYGLEDDLHAAANEFVAKHGATQGFGCSGESGQRCVAARLARHMKAQVDAAALFQRQQGGRAPEGGGVKVKATRFQHFSLLEGGAHGTFMVEHADAYVGAKLQSGQGEYEGPTLQLLLAACSRGALVLDVGANIGAFTVPLARAVGPPPGRVLAWEPQPHLANLLAANLALNIRAGVDPRTVRVHSDAVTERSGERMQMPEVLDYETGWRARRGSAEHDGNLNFAEVKLRPAAAAAAGAPEWASESIALDDVKELAPAAAARCPAVLKVDVETMEMAVLRGAKRLLRRCSATMVMYLETGVAGDAIASLCIEHGFDHVFEHLYDQLFSDDNPRTAFAGAKTTVVVGKVANTLCVSAGALRAQPRLESTLREHRAQGILRCVEGDHAALCGAVSAAHTTGATGARLRHQPPSLQRGTPGEQDCSAWGCSCQGFSDLLGTSHETSWGTANSAEQAWWLARRCDTVPASRA